MSDTAIKIEKSDILILKETLRKAANERMLTVIEPETCDFQEVKTRLTSTDDDWMVKIIVDVPDVIFAFRVYYQIKDAKTFAMSKSSLKNRVLSPFLCHDFIREYTNLTAGSLKAWIELAYDKTLNPDELIVNLPNQKPASAEPFSIKESLENEIWDQWQIHHKDAILTCSWNLKVSSWEGVTDMIQKAGVFETLKDGGVDFL